MAHFNIIVGSVLGASEYVADALKECLEHKKHSAAIFLEPEFTEIHAAKSDVWIICSSTHGAGELPDNIQAFAEALKNAKLTDVKFIVVGLGDSSYDTYCNGAMILEDLMKETGATMIAKPIHIDVLNHPIPEDTAVEWLENLISNDLSELA